MEKIILGSKKGLANLELEKETRGDEYCWGYIYMQNQNRAISISDEQQARALHAAIGEALGVEDENKKLRELLKNTRATLANIQFSGDASGAEALYEKIKTALTSQRGEG